MKQAKCRICRRAGDKLFIKGDRCYTAKCAMVKRPYPPGQKGKRRKRHPSEYAKELREKQKLKNWYNLSETQFKNYVKDVLSKKGKVKDSAGFLMKRLESRMDNIIFRLGFCLSRSKARQMVSHGYFLVNGRSCNIPSRLLKKGDKIVLKSIKTGKELVKEIKTKINKYKAPDWLELDKEKLGGKIIGEPDVEKIMPPVEISSIFEFYSK